MTADGSAVDVSGRLYNVMSASEAAQYTIENVLGGWDPQQYTRQVGAPTAALDGTTLTWNDAALVRCWVIFRNGVYLADVITTSYDVSGLSSGDTLTVRAANEMGGLSAISNSVVVP